MGVYTTSKNRAWLAALRCCNVRAQAVTRAKGDAGTYAKV